MMKINNHPITNTVKKAGLFLFIAFLMGNSSSCGPNHSNLSENIDVEITKQTIENCTYFCHYIDFKITNNNEVGIYMPLLRNYFKIINTHGDTITDIVRDYEVFNEYANDNTTDYYTYRKKIEVEGNAVLISLDDEVVHFVKSEYKLLTNALPKNIEISRGIEEDVKRELSLIKYSPIIYLSPKSSITLSESINYLYYNYMVEENYIVVGHDVYKLSDPIAKRFSELYENYENTKSPEVNIIFNYTAQSPSLEEDVIDFPLSYFGEDIQGSVDLPVKFPNKILDKYYLVEKLNGKDTLVIKFDE